MNYSMLKKLELFGSVFLWLIIFVKKTKKAWSQKSYVDDQKSWKSDILSWKSHGNSLLDLCGNPGESRSIAGDSGGIVLA